MIYYICLSELPFNSYVVVRRGDHQHDDAGIGSGRIWKPAQELLAPTHVSSHQRPMSKCLVATAHMEHMSPLPTRNQILNWLKRMKKKDRAETSQPDSDHVATAKHTVQECLQDPVENDTLQLFVIPIVLTGGTVRIVLAKCFMATWSACMHSETALCAGPACGRSLRVVPSGGVGGWWF